MFTITIQNLGEVAKVFIGFNPNILSRQLNKQNSDFIKSIKLVRVIDLDNYQVTLPFKEIDC